LHALLVGCVCAEKLTSEYVRPCLGEAAAKRHTAWTKTFLDAELWQSAISSGARMSGVQSGTNVINWR